MAAVTNINTCLVVGAGIAGLLAARELQSRGVAVTVIDKGRGVGGRMATRRIENAVFDHGAQFFTVRSERFRALVDGWLADGLACEWARGFAGPDGAPRHDGHPRYRGAHGMTTIPKALADNLRVRLAERVVSARVHDGQWVIETDRSARFTAEALILTPPVPQALALLEAGAHPLPDSVRAALATLDYAPCIALLALLWEPARVPAPGGLQLDDDPIAWIGDNTQKGISPEAYAVTVHGSAAFSRAYWHVESDLVAKLLLEAAAPWLGTRVKTHQLHRWRYSQPTRTHDAPCLLVEGTPPLVFAGDAFAGPRVEGAALSGLAAAAALDSKL